jgi:hypothetical protein
MWSFAQLLALTLLAVVAVITVACAGFYLSVRFPGHRVAGRIFSVTVTLAMAIIFSISLNHLWGATRDRDQRVWTARGQHLQRLQLLLRAESESLKGIAQALRQGRYFTLVADDARKAVWQDDTLTSDVERHFPEYFLERERLIRQVLEQDGERGQIRQVVSASLQLTQTTEPYRAEIVSAVVNKCGGAAPGISFRHVAAISSPPGMSASGTPDQSDPMSDAIRTHEQYRCTVELTRMCQALLDRAADLADTALVASLAARRHAEETVLHGSCTYAPAE